MYPLMWFSIFEFDYESPVSVPKDKPASNPDIVLIIFHDTTL